MIAAAAIRSRKVGQDSPIRICKTPTIAAKKIAAVIIIHFGYYQGQWKLESLVLQLHIKMINCGMRAEPEDFS